MTIERATLDSLRIERERDIVQPPSPRQQPLRSRLLAIGLIVAAIVAVLVGGAFALHEDVVEVEVAPVLARTTGSAAAVLNASGYVVARRQATVSSKVTGRIAEVFFEEGAAVRRGDLLARLDSSTTRSVRDLALRELASARKNIDEVRVRLEEAQRTLARMQQLRARNLVSEAQIDAASAEHQVLIAKLAALESEVKVALGVVQVREQDLKDLEITAPFDGVIVSKDAQPGEVVSPTSAGGGYTRTGIATLVDMASREIEVDVNEAFINRVLPGQSAMAVLDAYPDWELPCHVINIVPTADRQKATVRVRIGFDALDDRVLPDMGVKVRFLEQAAAAPGRTSVRVAASAIHGEGDARFVWRVHGGTVERVAVRVGVERDGEVDVLAGLDAGDMIVTHSSGPLKNGDKITTAADA